MSTELFPIDPLKEFLFEMKYDGPSFNGVMEIRALAEEISGMDECIREIISTLRKDKRIQLKDTDFQLLVEAFENNCFQKRIQLKIENNPETAATYRWLIGGIFGTIVTFVITNAPLSITPELLDQISDETAFKLLNDGRFMNNISRAIEPLRKDEDILYIKTINENVSDLVIPFSEKDKFLKLGDKKMIEEGVEQKYHDDMYGKIIAMDLHAKKNHVDFKKHGEGERIHCTFSDKLSINDNKDLLGNWVVIEGQVEKINGKVTHFLIEKIEKDDAPSEPIQGSIFE